MVQSSRRRRVAAALRFDIGARVATASYSLFVGELASAAARLGDVADDMHRREARGESST